MPNIPTRLKNLAKMKPKGYIVQDKNTSEWLYLKPKEYKLGLKRYSWLLRGEKVK